jgi:hypothetical protein
VQRANSAVALPVTSFFAVAFARVLRKGHLFQVAPDHCEQGEHANNRETDPEPPVKNYPDHGFSLARAAGLADIAAVQGLAIEVFVKTELDSGHQSGRHLVATTLFADDGAQFGVEIERLEAVIATAEVGLNPGANVGRELAVEEGF